MSKDFYRAFEDRYRGARAEIARRLGAYQPFVDALAATAPGPARPRALDLGCGRGEWLELLGASGYAARGVDLDEGMLRACRERHLDVERADALASLRALPDASVALVSAFHLVEHLPFELVQQIIGEAHRVLQPGGLLIFETPNPENLSVGANSFYLDPSHERPLPPPLLAFAVEFGGFARPRVVRLQEDPQLRAADAPVGLLTVLEGVSPDYAVVAQRDGDAARTAALAPLLAADYGLTLATLAQRYEARLQGRDSALHRALQHQAGELGALHAAHGVVMDDLRGQHAFNAAITARLDGDAARLAIQHALHEARLQPLEALPARLAALDERLAQLAAHNGALEQRIAAMFASTSWRVTAPLRLASTAARRGAALLGGKRLPHALRRRAGVAVRALMGAVLRRPALARAARALLARLPALQARLYRMARQTAAAPAAPPPPPSEQQLSPRAQLAHQQLQQHLQQRASRAGKH